MQLEVLRNDTHRKNVILMKTQCYVVSNMKQLKIGFLLALVSIVGCKVQQVEYDTLESDQRANLGHPFSSFSFTEDSIVVNYKDKIFDGCAYGSTTNGYMDDGTRICEDSTCYYEMNFRDGKLHGNWSMWSSNEVLLYSSDWKRGKLHGEAKGWFIDGRLEWEAIWDNGIRKSGLFYKEDGTVSEF